MTLGRQNFGCVIKTNTGITVHVRNIASAVALIGQCDRSVIQTNAEIVIEIRVARVSITITVIVFLVHAETGSREGTVRRVRAVVKGVRHTVCISIGRYARKRAERQPECE